jgi:uncharacterized linocin/CFP29 family protein
MPSAGRELVSWTVEQWKAIQEAADKALAGTAKCRQVIPKGPEKIGEKAVVVPGIGAGAPIAYGPDSVATPVHVYVDATLDDQHGANPAEVLRLVEVAAAQLGVLEDQEIVQGPPPPAPAPARGAPPPPPPRFGRVARNPALVRVGARAAGAAAPIAIGAGGANPTGAQLYAAITNAIAALEGVGRPGRFGLLVHNTLMATLKQPRVPGGVPLIQEVEALIGSNEIIGTSALDGTFVANAICGLLLRLEPAAVDLVHTQLPTVTVLGRAAGATDLRVEQEIVLRVLDPSAIQAIAY